MGSEDIIEVLKKKKRPMGRKEISEEIGWNPEKTSHHLKNLISNLWHYGISERFKSVDSFFNSLCDSWD